MWSSRAVPWQTGENEEDNLEGEKYEQQNKSNAVGR